VVEAHASRKLNEGVGIKWWEAAIILPFCSATMIVICDRSTCTDRDSPDSCKTMAPKCLRTFPKRWRIYRQYPEFRT
jgi:hypothetical protein